MILSLALLLSTTHILSRTIHQKSISICIRRQRVPVYNRYFELTFNVGLWENRQNNQTKQIRNNFHCKAKKEKKEMLYFRHKIITQWLALYLHFKRLHISTVSVLLFCNVQRAKRRCHSPGVRATTDNHANRPWYTTTRSIIIYCPTVCYSCPYNSTGRTQTRVQQVYGNIVVVSWRPRVSRIRLHRRQCTSLLFTLDLGPSPSKSKNHVTNRCVRSTDGGFPNGNDAVSRKRAPSPSHIVIRLPARLPRTAGLAHRGTYRANRVSGGIVSSRHTQTRTFDFNGFFFSPEKEVRASSRNYPRIIYFTTDRYVGPHGHEREPSLQNVSNYAMLVSSISFALVPAREASRTERLRFRFPECDVPFFFFDVASFSKIERNKPRQKCVKNRIHLQNLFVTIHVPETTAWRQQNESWHRTIRGGGCWVVGISRPNWNLLTYIIKVIVKFVSRLLLHYKKCKYSLFMRVK